MRRLSWVVIVFVVLTSLLSTATISGAGPPTVRVIAGSVSDPVNIRSDPNMDARVIEQVGHGSQLTLSGADIVTSPDGWRWVPVSLGFDIVGYVRADLVSAPYSSGPQTVTNSYPPIDARDLSKAPYRYEGKSFCQMGFTFNVFENDGMTFIQMYPSLPYVLVSGNPHDYPVYVIYPGILPGLYKDMRIVVYGVGNGTRTFTNTVGGTTTQPLIQADSVLVDVAANQSAPCLLPQI